MGVYNRPNGTTDFTNDPNVDPATGAKFDAELNGLTSTVNAIDNANIAATPKIDGTKLDLTTTGFLATTGGTMTGTIAYSYDGIWHEYRAAGNAQVRTYRGSDGAEIGWSYNTKWDEGTGAWLGRDITGTCSVLKVTSSGLKVDTAPSAASGVTPVFSTVFEVNANGVVLDSNAYPVETLSDKILPTSATAYTTVDTMMIYIPVSATSMEYYVLIYADAGAGTSSNLQLTIGAVTGTILTTTSTVPVWAGAGTIALTTLSGWVTVNIQLKHGGSGTNAYVSKVVGRII